MQNIRSNYSHLKGERHSGYLKPLNLKVNSYGGLVVSFKYILTEPEKGIFICVVFRTPLTIE